jgi:MarR family 2-MHQ and catechol resistance regulon transcriptional repressor
LDKLEAEELITRNNKSGDRRVKIIKITEKGSGLIDEIWADYNKTVNALTPNMTDDELQFMIDKLVKWHNDIK